MQMHLSFFRGPGVFLFFFFLETLHVQRDVCVGALPHSVLLSPSQFALEGLRSFFFFFPSVFLSSFFSFVLLLLSRCLLSSSRRASRLLLNAKCGKERRPTRLSNHSRPPLYFSPDPSSSSSVPLENKTTPDSSCALSNRGLASSTASSSSCSFQKSPSTEASSSGQSSYTRGEYAFQVWSLYQHLLTSGLLPSKFAVDEKFLETLLRAEESRDLDLLHALEQIKNFGLGDIQQEEGGFGGECFSSSGWQTACQTLVPVRHPNEVIRAHLKAAASV